MIKSTILVMVLCFSMAQAGAFSKFVSQIFDIDNKEMVDKGYPSATQAFRDYAAGRTFMFTKEALGSLGMEPHLFNHSYRIPFVYNVDEGRISGIQSVVIQMVVTYRAERCADCPAISDSLVGFLKSDDNYYYLKDRVFVYYTKTIDGWLYVGAETSFTGLVYREFFVDNPLVFWGTPFGIGKDE